MQVYLNNTATHTFSVGNKTMYIIKFSLVRSLIKKWKYNRDPDNKRVKDIYACLKTGGFIPTYMNLADVDENGLVCFDGNHRREAMEMLLDDGIDTDTICSVLFNATNDDVRGAFLNINKAVDVPEIYLEDNLSSVKSEIIDVVFQYEKKYKKYLSQSKFCHKPNFNRDNFIDNITEIYKYFDGKFSVEEIRQLLDKLNLAYSQEKICKPHSQYGKKVIEKCRSGGLWLFVDGRVSPEHLAVVRELET